MICEVLKIFMMYKREFWHIISKTLSLVTVSKVCHNNDLFLYT